VPTLNSKCGKIHLPSQSLPDVVPRLGTGRSANLKRVENLDIIIGILRTFDYGQLLRLDAVSLVPATRPRTPNLAPLSLPPIELSSADRRLRPASRALGPLRCPLWVVSPQKEWRRIISYGQGIGLPACLVACAGLPPARPPCAEPLAALRTALRGSP
jgi:hypothetical protein